MGDGEMTQQGPAARPDIPPELVWRNSYEAFTQELDDPYHAVSRLEGAPPVIWATNVANGRSGWIVTRHDIMAEACLKPELFSNGRPTVAVGPTGVKLKLNPVHFDPPEHHGYRRILQPLFTPKAVGKLNDSVRRTCAELIGPFQDRGGCEFIEDFAVPFPSYIFLDLMGLPRELLPKFLGWEDAMMRSGDAVGHRAASSSIYVYLETFLEEQRQQPTSELVGAILEAEYDGRPLDHLEIMGMLYVLYLAGLDTVHSTLGWVMRHLATHPELQERLRAEPALVPAAAEEFLRAFPVANTYRMVKQDCVFYGAPLRKGDELHLPLPLAGRDSRVYDDPHRIDIDRNPRHLTFGSGPHVCLGAHLARREICIVVDEFLRRFRSIRLRDGEAYRYHTYVNFAVDYLPLELRI
jgi:cytochrome P450